MAERSSTSRTPAIRVRGAALSDLDALMELEQQVFATDRMSRRSLRHFLRAPTARVIVAEIGGELAGTATLLFRPKSAVGRLYSIAVVPAMAGRGVASELLSEAERIASGHGCTQIRLEVHASNHRAIARYYKSGYREFGRMERYYEDGGDALRLYKQLQVGTAGPVAAK